MAKCIIRGTDECIEMDYVDHLNGIVRPVLSHSVDGWKKVKFWTRSSDQKCVLNRTGAPDRGQFVDSGFGRGNHPFSLGNTIIVSASCRSRGAR
jgi:hypothetical protein